MDDKEPDSNELESQLG